MVLFMTAPGLALLLWWAGSQEERHECHVAVHFPHGVDDAGEGGLRLLFGVRRFQSFSRYFDYLFLQGVARSWDANLGACVTPMHDTVTISLECCTCCFRDCSSSNPGDHMWCVCRANEV